MLNKHFSHNNLISSYKNIPNNNNDNTNHQRRASMEIEVFLTSKLNERRKSIHPFKNLITFNSHKQEDLNIQKQIMKSNQKRKEIKMSNKMKQRKILDKLYGVTPLYTHKYHKTQKQKNLDLESYQNNLLNFFSTETNIDKRDFMDLLQNFEEIKEHSQSISPLPKINFNNIYEHVRIQNERKNDKSDKMLSLKDYLRINKNRRKDDFELEQEEIAKSKKYKIIPKKKRNRNLDLLPPHIREALNKHLKFHG